MGPWNLIVPSTHDSNTAIPVLAKVDSFTERVISLREVPSTALDAVRHRNASIRVSALGETYKVILEGTREARTESTPSVLCRHC